MRKIQLKNKVLSVMGHLALVLLGLLIGIAVTNMLLCHRVDNLLMIQKALEIELQEAYVKIDKMEKAAPKTINPTLKDIELEMIVSERDYNTGDAEQYIKELLRDQIGKDLEDIDIEMMYKAIDQRIAQFDGKRYKFKIQYILLSSTLYINVSMNQIDSVLGE